jgi:hypothetical protein
MADEMTQNTASRDAQFSFDAFDHELSPGPPHLYSETRRVSDVSNCTDFQWHLRGAWESLLIPAELVVQRGGGTGAGDHRRERSRCITAGIFQAEANGATGIAIGFTRTIGGWMWMRRREKREKRSGIDQSLDVDHANWGGPQVGGLEALERC